MTTSVYPSLKFWKTNKLTLARKACPKEAVEYRDPAREILYSKSDAKELKKTIKAYHSDVKKLFKFQIECLAKLGYVFDVSSVYSGFNSYMSTYSDNESTDDDGNVVTHIDYSCMFDMAFSMASVKWCEQNYGRKFPDLTTGTVIFVSGSGFTLKAGDENSSDFNNHAEAVSDYLRNGASTRMASYGPIYLIIKNIENNFTRTHREIFDSLKTKDAARLQLILDEQWY